MQQTNHSVLQFWFGDAVEHPERALARNALWYSADADFDAAIAARFGTTLGDALDGGLDHWANDPDGALALVIVLDQFPRNVWRGCGRSFAGDERALELARQSIAAGFLAPLTPVERTFLAMPLQHSESLAVQRESVALFERLLEMCEPTWKPYASGNLEFARRHSDVIERFGRFPHRNALLDRAATDEEIAWLAAGGETFGADKKSRFPPRGHRLWLAYALLRTSDCRRRSAQPRRPAR